MVPLLGQGRAGCREPLDLSRTQFPFLKENSSSPEITVKMPQGWPGPARLSLSGQLGPLGARALSNPVVSACSSRP